MARKRIKVQPSKKSSKFTFFVGIGFCLIGVFMAIPMAGLFGVLWTAIAVYITYYHFKNGFTDEGIPTHEIIVNDDTIEQKVSTNNIEERLKKLEDLYQQRLITREEYDEKRKELIDQI